MKPEWWPQRPAKDYWSDAYMWGWDSADHECWKAVQLNIEKEIDRAFSDLLEKVRVAQESVE